MPSGQSVQAGSPGLGRSTEGVLSAAVAGGLQALAFAPLQPLLPNAWDPGFDALWPPACQVLALLLLLTQLRRAHRPAHAALLGWVFGSMWLVGATGWMFVSLHRYGGLPAWLSALAVLALCMVLAVYMAAVGGLWQRWRHGHWAPDALLLGALWLLAEVARALIFTGFPWAASGYAWVDTPLAALAPWVGVYGMGWAVATGVAAVALAWPSRQDAVGARPDRGVKWLLGALAVVVGVLVWRNDSFVQPHGRLLRVTLLQSAVPQDEKFVPEHQMDALVWHAQQLAAAQADLVMAPETAIPLLPADLPQGYWQGLIDHFHQGRTAVLLGVPLGSMEAGYTNSVAGISAGTRGAPGGIYQYNKYHLVPFGEFIPWGFRWFVQMMNMPLGDFSRGLRDAPSFEVAGQQVAPNICYEDLFGEELAARFVSPGRPAPTVLANVSNLAWFGEHVAMAQHLNIARMRSIEFQRPTLRSTNTGATVVIDHQGRVTASLPFNTRGALQAQVQGMGGLTPYARWAGHWGLWPLIGLALAVVAGTVMARP